MPGSSRARLALCFTVAALLAATVLPTAAADHSYSHRYFVYGRIVGADGAPLANERVGLEYQTFNADLGPCNYEVQAGSLRGLQVSQTSNDVVSVVTNAFGDFFYCAHIDAPVPRGAAVTIHVRDVVKTFPADLNYRHTFATIEVPNVNGTANAAWATTLETAGTVWYAGDITLENIGVHGTMVDAAPVHVKLVYNDGKTIEKDLTTTRYGNWSDRFTLAEPLASGTLTVTANGVTQSFPVDAKFHTMSADMTVPSPPNLTLRYTLFTLGGLVVVGGASFAGYRFYSANREARELARVRETTTRKRAQR